MPMKGKTCVAPLNRPSNQCSGIYAETFTKGGRAGKLRKGRQVINETACNAEVATKGGWAGELQLEDR